ncbi:nucleotidyl transferase AbiEii/AbiGii toxin family protein [Marivirga sp.]|uniref:nucleotidyl transferase AbiEii/AbiGii toxin family protein n=1 Tax=Marivirga sp. TaxID=2018662 RepID=UPI0025F8FA6A|nr:nucleotidyl transferase AbiEii/AbiGii toxin family protein [Marivirga sp.]
MLHLETITGDTLELLKSIANSDLGTETRLVGGTSLALQLGHRISVDLDFFGNINLEPFEIEGILNDFGETYPLKVSKLIKIYNCNSIKLDLVQYNYPWLEEAIVWDNIKLAGLKDIAAMKIGAITGRGSKKDFIDLYELLKHFSLKQMIEFYKEKYKDGSVYLALKSLIYFDDAEEQVKEYPDSEPELLYDLSWEEVKSKILKVHQDYMNSI